MNNLLNNIKRFSQNLLKIFLLFFFLILVGFITWWAIFPSLSDSIDKTIDNYTSSNFPVDTFDIANKLFIIDPPINNKLDFIKFDFNKERVIITIIDPSKNLGSYSCENLISSLPPKSGLRIDKIPLDKQRIYVENRPVSERGYKTITYYPDGLISMDNPYNSKFYNSEDISILCKQKSLKIKIYAKTYKEGY